MLKSVRVKRVLSVCIATLLVLMCTIFLVPENVEATGNTYYVDQDNVNASDTNPGTEALPFKTINKAAGLTAPGDTVLIKNATYTDPVGSVLNVTKPGTAAGYITFKAYPGHTPVLSAPNAWNIVSVCGPSYIKIEGLTVHGNAANITYDEAYAMYTYYKNTPTASVDWARMAPFNTNGICVRENQSTKVKSHHVEIRNCKVSDCPGAGIAACYTDYITVEDCIANGNCKWMIYAGSGISFLGFMDVDSYTGYKNFVRRNIVFDNECLIPWADQGTAISDGDGIIIDTFWGQGRRRVLLNRRVADYKAKTLVENNIAYENGGAGIYGCGTINTDFINNTSYNNNRSPVLDYGELRSGWGKNVNFINNIGYARTGKRNIDVTMDYGNTIFSYNIAYGGTNSVYTGTNNITTDPKFMSIASYNFKLQADSPAIDSGTTTLAPTVDIINTTRPQGAGIDRGAYEFIP